MANLGKIDMACIGLMVIVILTASGYWAVFAGFVLVGGTLVWVGWVWWVVFAFVIISLILMAVTSRQRRE
ncbi:MAG: hypothetical protein ACFFDJ_04845 [Candidatus Odinarchaeota archaeon]